MKIALIDNGSLEPAAHLNLRAIATALSEKTGMSVDAVSWKHSDRVAASALGGKPAWTLVPFIRTQLTLGEREFIFVPFFISPQGAIGSTLRGDLERLRRDTAAEGGFDFTFTEGLAERGAIAGLVVERVHEAVVSRVLHKPAVIVVDHGGPSPASAALRDSLANQVRTHLGQLIGPLVAASMEGVHRPLLVEQLAARGFGQGDVVIAQLFLSPGRHAGPDGDVAKICRSAEERAPGLHCHLTGLVGTHPRVAEPLAFALRQTLENFHVKSLE